MNNIRYHVFSGDEDRFVPESWPADLGVAVDGGVGPGLILVHSMDGLRQWWSCCLAR